MHIQIVQICVERFILILSKRGDSMEEFVAKVMSKNDTISIKGKLHSYVDKDNNPKTVINCTDIDILEISKNQNEKTK